MIRRAYSQAHRKWITVGDEFDHLSTVKVIQREQRTGALVVSGTAHTKELVPLAKLPPDATIEYFVPAPELAE